MSAPEPPRVRSAWYVACWSSELRRRPLQRRLFGEPIVLFRAGDRGIGAFVDRCPHRGVPLSEGRVVGDRLQCAYHGWQFDCAGACRAIPGFLGEPDKATRRPGRHAVREQQGLVWVWGEPDAEPVGEPFESPWVDARGYTVIREDVQARANLHMVAENALDVPHTAFLHGGLFRSETVRNRITAVVKRWHDRVECEYIGEPRPTGLVARLLSPSGGVVQHWDRFFLPSVVQVEYRIGDENHIVVTAACTPLDDYQTRLYATVAVKSRIPGFLLRLAKPLGLRIFHQDAAILELQTEQVHRFGEQAFVSTDVDLLGPHILRLLRRAERGELGDPDAAPFEKTVEMEA